jgi:SAM-dependent methyltransferase
MTVHGADRAPLTLPASAGPDPLAASTGGVWDDGGLLVVRGGRSVPTCARLHHRAADLEVHLAGDRVVVAHEIPASRVDNALAAHIAETLVGVGALVGDDVVGRVVTGIIRTMHPNPVAAWSLFYGNSMGRFADPAARGGDAVDVFGRIYRQASRRAVGRRLLDVGTCLGFLPLYLAARGDVRVLATDLLPGAAQLLDAVARHMGVGLWSVAADACALPLAAQTVDTAYAIHVLEHLDEGAGKRALAELQRVAAQRVVVAVPLEEVPDPAFGHVRSFDLDLLAELGEHSGWCWRVEELEGGWLVLDRRPRASTLR